MSDLEHSRVWERRPFGTAYRVVALFTGPWTWANLRGWLRLIGLILLFKGCVMDQYTVPTGSMEPTLHGNWQFFRDDRIVVNKWRYGPRIPFTTTRPWKWGGPSRWDIVVFDAVHEEAKHGTLVKRVVGLPGERIEIRDGWVFVDGVAAEAPEDLRGILHYVGGSPPTPLEICRSFLELAAKNEPLSFLNPHNPGAQQLYADMERVHGLLGGREPEGLSNEEAQAMCRTLSQATVGVMSQIAVLEREKMLYGILPDEEHSVVPEGHYFLLGDNSDESFDSRFWGWVPHEHLYGEAFAVWWPWHRRRDFSGFSSTWWGAGLLYGIPLALVGMEAYHLFRRRRGKGDGSAQDC